MTDRLDAQRARAERLRELHRAPEIVVLVNAWDVASARTTAAQPGCQTIATAGHAIAEVFGYEDGENISATVMLDAVGRIASAVDLPVTADLEARGCVGPERENRRVPVRSRDRDGACGPARTRLSRRWARVLLRPRLHGPVRPRRACRHSRSGTGQRHVGAGWSQPRRSCRRRVSPGCRSGRRSTMSSCHPVPSRRARRSGWSRCASPPGALRGGAGRSRAGPPRCEPRLAAGSRWPRRCGTATARRARWAPRSGSGRCPAGGGC